MAAPVSTKPGWRFGVFEVDAQRGDLRRAGVPLKLREQSFQILLALLDHPGEIVTREELRRLLWPSDTFVDFDHSLNTAMMKLRDALGDSTESPIYIETIPKRGYRFIAPVSARADPPGPPAAEAPVPSAQPEAATPPTPDPVNPVATPVRRRIRVWIAAAGILLVLVVATLVLLRTRNVLFPERSDRGAPTSYRIDSVTTFRGSVKDPAITPDGRDVAYAWNGGGGDHWDIYVQRIGSPIPMRLTYIKTGFVGYPAWSPDQREIAFTRCDGMNDGVYIVPALGGPERKLTSTSCQFHIPTPVAWLPDSRMLMLDRCPASGLHALVLFSMDTAEKRCIADFGPRGVFRRFHYSVSPDQKTVAFIPSDASPVCEIYTLLISLGSPHRIVEDKAYCYEVMWTPDGKEIVFLSGRTNFDTLWQVPANGGQLSSSIYPAIGTFSKDGRRFVYEEEANGEPPGVWSADLASPGGKVFNNKKLIATQFWESEAQPSPDGARIVWQDFRENVAELWTSSSSGENQLQLTHLNAYSGTPRWSPDGKWIAFDSNAPGSQQIYVIDVEGRNLRAITQGKYMNNVPSWSRDGKSIYFASTRSGRRDVWKHSLETGNEFQLTTHGGFDPFESFDGQTVYFSKWDEAGIWSIPSNGGKETLVVEGRPQVLYWGHWALTRPGIYFLNADTDPRARIEFYDFGTGRTSPVLSLEKNAVIRHPSLSATADGKTIYYAQMDLQTVIEMMEFSR